MKVISAFYDSFVVLLRMIVLFEARARVHLWFVQYIWGIFIILSSLFPRFFLLTTHTLGVIPHVLLTGERQLCWFLYLFEPQQRTEPKNKNMRQKNVSLYLGFLGWLRFQGGGFVFIESVCCGLCTVLCAVYLCIILCIFGARVYLYSV